MSRGYSKAKSELPDVNQYGESGRKYREGVYAPNSYKAWSIDFIDRYIRGGLINPEDVHLGTDLNEAANYVYDAVEENNLLYDFQKHSERVQDAKAVLKEPGNIEFSRLRNVLPLTREEMADADKKNEGFSSAAKRIAIYAFDDARESDTRGNFSGNDDDDKPYFARKMLQERIESAKEQLNEMRDDVETTALTAFRRWVNLREKGNI
jgi:hypothetical protein